ncbi:invasion associated locus B family protein [Xanthobacter tagetidis]|uniref:invasion associated locus B family protein n=1 Tax=Xanthobacter tagetidis TaxID=60216 RepID=UPI0011C3879E|nr:invasion associated locus B family protein [Xanthobacter tagetidis]MBB6308612.1 invasion protein IalB [Xanthobacter tagetidis]
MGHHSGRRDSYRRAARGAGLAVILAALAASGAAAQTPPPAKPKPEPAKPAAPAAAPAPAASGPDSTAETYGDWVLRCWPNGAARRCELSQRLLVQGQSAPVALIAFGRDGKGAPLRMVVQLPVNVTMEGGVKAAAASGDGLADLAFRRCAPGGCFADVVLADPALARLKAQSEPPALKYRDAAEREMALPFSLKGFAAAIDALLRS